MLNIFTYVMCILIRINLEFKGFQFKRSRRRCNQLLAKTKENFMEGKIQVVISCITVKHFVIFMS